MGKRVPKNISVIVCKYIKKTNYIVCFKTLKKEKKKEGKTVQEPKLLLA